MSKNAVKKVEISEKLHHDLKGLAFNVDMKMKRLASAIIYEALSDKAALANILKKLKHDERYYDKS